MLYIENTPGEYQPGHLGEKHEKVEKGKINAKRQK
jgi:hypothetical protein